MATTGISIVESSLNIVTNTTTYVERTYVFGTATGANIADLNTPVRVENFTAFTARFSGVAPVTAASIRLFFRNFSEGNLFFVACKNPDLSDASDPKGDLIYGISKIALRTDLRLGTVLCPEQCAFTVQADRTAVYAALHGMCEKLDWMNLINTALTTQTPAAAETERTLYSAVQGHSALYFKAEKDIEGVDVPITPIVAAIAQRRGRDVSAYAPPGGADYPVSGLQTPLNVVNEQDYYALQAKNINTLQQVGRDGNYYVWGARTLSTDERFLQINTRIANSLISKELEYGLIPFLFDSVDPQGFTRRQIVMTGVSILQNAYANGGLSGDTPEQAFKVEEISTINSGLRKIQIKLLARFVDTLEMIEVALVNVTNIPQ